MEDRRQMRLMARVAASPRTGPLHERICHESVSILSVSTAALILMSRDEAGALAFASDESATTVEDLQFSLGEGPCLEAFENGGPVLEADLHATNGRWPGFVAAAVEAGVRAVFALPLQLGAIRLGVLYLNRRKAGMLSQDELADAFVLAEMATVALLEGRDEARSGELGPEIDGAWAHRAIVHQATGVISARLEIPIDGALLRLRSLVVNGRSLYDVSRDVVEGRLGVERGGGER